MFDGFKVEEEVAIGAGGGLVHIPPHLLARTYPLQHLLAIGRVEDGRMDGPAIQAIGQKRVQPIGRDHDGDVGGGVFPLLHALQQAGPGGACWFVGDLGENPILELVLFDEGIGQTEVFWIPQ